MKSINFGALNDGQMPYIFQNAWTLDKQKLALFSNRGFQKQLNENYDYHRGIDART